MINIQNIFMKHLIFKTTNDNELRLFFQQETHNEVKEKLRFEF